MPDSLASIPLRCYRPSTGTEGACFIERWCFNCKHDQPYRDGDFGDSCPIVANSFVYDVEDPNYPPEWQYGADGIPICTAFQEIDAPDRQDPNAAIGDLFR